MKLNLSYFFTPGKKLRCESIKEMIDKLPTEASLYGNSAYADYKLEVHLIKDSEQLKRQKNRPFETKNEKSGNSNKWHQEIFSRIIHAVTLEGFPIALTLFVLQLNKSIN